MSEVGPDKLPHYTEVEGILSTINRLFPINLKGKDNTERFCSTILQMSRYLLYSLPHPVT